MDWINIPTLDRSDDAFYAPLKNLDLKGSRLYLGLIHNMERFEARRATAAKYIRDFGLSAPCGFGRSPPEALPGILQDHIEALRIVRT